MVVYACTIVLNIKTKTQLTFSPGGREKTEIFITLIIYLPIFLLPTPPMTVRAHVLGLLIGNCVPGN